MDELSHLLRKRARWTWRRLQDAHSVPDLGYSHIREDGFTNFNLLYLRVHAPKGLRIELFKGDDEQSTGADWEWWFIGAGGSALGFRVQAKVINDRRTGYDHLHHFKEPTGPYQVERLIEDAARGPYRKIPAYCLYTHWIGGRKSAAPGWDANLKPSDYGCAWLDADYVHSNREKSETRTLSHLFSRLRPWHCLFTNPAIAAMDLPERVLSGWNNAFRREPAKPIPSDIIHPEMPDWLWRLRKFKERDQAARSLDTSKRSDPQSIGADITPLSAIDELVGLSGVVVFQEDETYKQNQLFSMPPEPPIPPPEW